MNTDVTQAAGYKGGSALNVVSFAGYIARNGRKPRRYFKEDTNLVSFAGCDVVYLSEHRR